MKWMEDCNNIYCSSPRNGWLENYSNLRTVGQTNFITRNHKEFELTDQTAVRDIFEFERLEQVYLDAAKIGGLC